MSSITVGKNSSVVLPSQGTSGEPGTFQVCEQVAEHSSKVASLTKNVLKTCIKIFPKFSLRLPSRVRTGIEFLSGITLLTVPFTATRLFANIQKIHNPSTPLKDKVVTSLKSVMDTADIVDGASKVCTLLSIARVVSDRITCWIPVFELINFFLRFIGVGLSIKENIDFENQLKSLRVQLQKVQNCTHDEEKKAILSALLGTMKPHLLEKEFDISQKEQVQQKIESLRMKLLDHSAVESKQGIEDAKMFFETFKGRVQKRIGLSIAGTVHKIVGVVGGAFLFSPLSLVGVVILSLSACVGFGLTYSRKLLFSPNPFDKNEPIPLVRYASWVKNHIFLPIGSSVCGQVNRFVHTVFCARQTPVLNPIPVL